MYTVKNETLTLVGFEREEKYKVNVATEEKKN